jgi:hypothetical protein
MIAQTLMYTVVYSLSQIKLTNLHYEVESLARINQRKRGLIISNLSNENILSTYYLA